MEKLAVGVIVVRDARVLLGLRRGGAGEGMWGFPGGRVDPGEHPLLAAGRELSEETGLRARRLTPLTWTTTMADGAFEPWLVLFVLAQADGEPQRREPGKCEQWGFFDWQDPPTPLFHGPQRLRDAGFVIPGTRPGPGVSVKHR